MGTFPLKKRSIHPKTHDLLHHKEYVEKPMRRLTWDWCSSSCHRKLNGRCTFRHFLTQLTWDGFVRFLAKIVATWFKCALWIFYCTKCHDFTKKKCKSFQNVQFFSFLSLFLYVIVCVLHGVFTQKRSPLSNIKTESSNALSANFSFGLRTVAGNTKSRLSIVTLIFL